MNARESPESRQAPEARGTEESALRHRWRFDSGEDEEPPFPVPDTVLGHPVELTASMLRLMSRWDLQEVVCDPDWRTTPPVIASPPESP